VIVVSFGVTLGVAAGLAARAVPADLGVASLSVAGGVVPSLVAAAVLAFAYIVLLFFARKRRAGRAGLLLAVGLLPVAALLVAGPVTALYFLLWPTIIILPAALVLASRPTNV
jgi:hypothetical protein